MFTLPDFDAIFPSNGGQSISLSGRIAAGQKSFENKHLRFDPTGSQSARPAAGEQTRFTLPACSLS
jgi:hypothetical protein